MSCAADTCMKARLCDTTSVHLSSSNLVQAFHACLSTLGLMGKCQHITVASRSGLPSPTLHGFQHNKVAILQYIYSPIPSRDLMQTQARAFGHQKN